jgi:hypothetical protein
VVLEAPRRRLIVLTLAAVAVVAGCGGSHARLVPKAKLADLVLQPGDLPAAFAQFDGGRQVQLDNPTGPRRDPARFGREDGWKARYHRGGTKTTRGPLVVSSRADLFAEPSGAADDLDAYRDELAAVPGARALADPKLGDGAVASTSLQAGGVRAFTVAWRDRNVSASVAVDGFDGRVTLADALQLARRQERRISAS